MKASSRLITNVRRSLLAIGVTGTALALFITEENWRGDRAWTAYAREQTAKGEILENLPPGPVAIPDERNFFKSPGLARVLDDDPNDVGRKGFLQQIKFDQFDFHLPNDGLRELRDNWRKHLTFAAESENPAVDVLKAMEPLAPFLNEVRAAARDRPEAAPDRLHVPIDRIDVGAAFKVGQALVARATAELAVNQVDEAAADVFALLRLGNGFVAPSETLIELMVGEAMRNLAAGVIMVGCHQSRWSESQLAEFQHLLHQPRVLAELAKTLRRERATAFHTLDFFPATKVEPKKPWWLFRGWMQQNKKKLGEHYEQVLQAFGSNPERLFTAELARQNSISSAIKQSRSPFEWASRFVFMNFSEIGESFAREAALDQQVGVACALARFRLARGHAADDLAALVPTFLAAVPIDLFDGQPLRYQTPASGTRRLYSVGPNGRDDAGQDDDVSLLLPDSS